MPIEIHVHTNIGQLVVIDDFTIKSRKEFCTAYRTLIKNKEVSEIRVDLLKATDMDSSGLGLILLLKDRAEAEGKIVTLSNLSGRVAAIIALTDFDTKFKFVTAWE